MNLRIFKRINPNGNYTDSVQYRVGGILHLVPWASKSKPLENLFIIMYHSFDNT